MVRVQVEKIHNFVPPTLKIPKLTEIFLGNLLFFMFCYKSIENDIKTINFIVPCPSGKYPQFCSKRMEKNNKTHINYPQKLLEIQYPLCFTAN